MFYFLQLSSNARLFVLPKKQTACSCTGAGCKYNTHFLKVKSKAKQSDTALSNNYRNPFSHVWSAKGNKKSAHHLPQSESIERLISNMLNDALFIEKNEKKASFPGLSIALLSVASFESEQLLSQH